MSEMTAFWVLILGVAAGTFLIRSLPIWLYGRARGPKWLERLLRHVPAAALTALIVPNVLYTSSDGIYAFAPARTIAAVVALAVAVRTRNVIATLATGMIVLWLAQAVAAGL
jgi:branched-subunit amino acid transport protein